MSGDLAELDHYMDFGDDYSYFAKLQANSRCRFDHSIACNGIPLRLVFKAWQVQI